MLQRLNTNKTLFLILYFTLLVGFYFGENSSGGAYGDFQMRIGIIESFKNDFTSTFLKYDQFRDRHSPVILIILASINRLGLDLDFVRLLHLNFLPLLVLASYKCLSYKFPSVNKNIIFIISCVFFLSPSLRSISIWPDSRISGLLFFLISLFYFLKFQKTNKFKHCIYNNIFLIFSSYLSPNFSLFFLYFFYTYLNFFKLSKNLYLMLLINTILSLPAFYYLFVLEINFLIKTVSSVDTLTRLNPANKILLISTLIFFYMIPIISNVEFLKSFRNNFKLKNIFYSLVIFIILIFFFNYSGDFSGGGIFFKLSYFIFNNNYFFLLISLVSIIIITTIFSLNLNNSLLFLILIISNPQMTIYHKYFDLLLILLFFLLVDFKFDIKKYFNKNLIKNIYVFYIIFLALNFGRYLL